MQEVNNCRIEIERTSKEQLALQEWLIREYHAATAVHHASNGTSFNFFSEWLDNSPH
jgi:hypothetical protein